MNQPLHLFNVGLSCGHRIQFQQYPNLAPQPGDETWCDQHRPALAVTVTDCVDQGAIVDPPAASGDGFVWSW